MNPFKNTPEFEHRPIPKIKNSKNPRVEPLEAIVAESIHSVLSEVLGVDLCKSIYDYLGWKGSSKSEVTPEDVDRLSMVLVGVFGNAGGRILSTRIVKRVYERFDLQFAPVNGYTFRHYIEFARNRINEKHGESGDSKPI
jgi:hypothetical protein